MLTFLDFFIMFIVVVILFLYIKNYYAEVTYVKSTTDGRNYLVRKLPDRQQAADMLASINKDLHKLVKHLAAKYPDKDTVKRLFENFNPNNISEGSAQSGYTSYSVNKGERIILCIRQKDSQDTFVDKNVVMYVAIHELAHLATESIGHDQSFWNNFKFIIKEAIDIGIYKKVDFVNKPTAYCGIKITSSVI
jgi:predicted metal-dependent hydrolase